MKKILFTSLWSFTILACKHHGSGESQLKVTESVRAESWEVPAVVKLTMVRKDGSSTYCTATYLSDKLLLTAAHCIFDKQDSFRQYKKFLVNGIEVQDVKPHPDYYPLTVTGKERSNWDLALVLMPFSGAKVTKAMDLSLVNKGDQLKLVGFGRSTSDGEGNKEGEKLIGCSYVSEVQERLYLVNGKVPEGVSVGNPACRSVPGSGDSGGPAFRNGKIIGTVSGQYENDGFEITRLNWPEITTFFKSLEKTKFEIPNLGTSSAASEQESVVDEEGEKLKVTYEDDHVKLEGRLAYFLYYNCKTNGRAGEGVWHHERDAISATFWESKKLFNGPGLEALDMFSCSAP